MRVLAFVILSLVLTNVSAWQNNHAYPGSFPNERIYPYSAHAIGNSHPIGAIYYAIGVRLGELQGNILDWRIDVSDIDDLLGNLINPTTKEYIYDNGGLDGTYNCYQPVGNILYCDVILFYPVSWTGFDGTEVYMTFSSPAVYRTR